MCIAIHALILSSRQVCVANNMFFYHNPVSLSPLSSLSKLSFMLQSTPCKHPVIVLQDVIFEDLHALVEFIYHGEVNVHQKALPSFLKTAEVLRVSGLTQQSEVREEVCQRSFSNN